jgi:hypothetical protein
VGDEDYEYINECYDLTIDSGGYVQCKLKPKFRYKRLGLWGSLSLHKLLMNPETTGRSINVDHIDGDPLNNEKSNLRVCTHQENAWNRKPSDGYTSPYKGVFWDKFIEKWRSHIRVDMKLINLGCFTNEIAAANCYNYWASYYFGEFALLNDVEQMSEAEWSKYSSASKKTSKYRGVSFSDNRYVAQIWDGKRNLVIGRFTDEIEAALAYNQRAIELKGDKAKLNKI